MPIYEFECRKCGERFEAIRPMGDAGKGLKCPECDASAPRKVPAVFAAGSSGGGGRASSTSFG